MLQVRDSIEIVHTSEYPSFLKFFFDAFDALLRRRTKPRSGDATEQRLRTVVLEVLNRLPQNDILRPYVDKLLDLVFHVLKEDSEETAVVCLRIMFDAHKTFRPELSRQVQPFLEFVLLCYRSFGESLKALEEAAPPEAGASPPSPPSANSFKVVMECPLIVMFLFQLYPEYVKVHVPMLLPLMVQSIGLANVKEETKLKPGYTSFRGAQVKTVSFLTYLLKSPAYVASYQGSICKSIVRLLASCPDIVAVRKELLVATRHVLATEHRVHFFPYLDELLGEGRLIGRTKSCYDALRPLAFSLLAELIHHMRMQLTLPQLSHIIHTFSRNVHDPTLPFSVQMTCVRLILNLVESIYNVRQDPRGQVEGRVLLSRILYAFMDKFSSLRAEIPKILGEQARASKAARPDLLLAASPQQDSDKTVNDCKHLVKTLILGMKTLLWSITNFNRVPQQPRLPGVQTGLTDEEVRATWRLLTSGVKCLEVFGGSSEAVEVYDHFAAIFSVLESRNFYGIFSKGMPHLFDELTASSSLVQIPAHLLASPDTSRPFGNILATFLVGYKLKELSHPTSAEGFLVLRLFQLLFGTLAKFPESETVLHARLAPFMEDCLKGMQKNANPAGYIHLVRALFKAMGGGKLDKLYGEFLYVLPATIKTFHNMLEGPKSHALREPLVELCLTIPVRLPALLPHLRLMMKPLLYALQSSNELVGLGLRTMEFWVDSLNPDFLDPEMAPVEDEVMAALWTHLRPRPYPFGAKALQLLGKLGGRNRKFLQRPMELDYKPNPEHGLRLILTFEPNTSFLVPLDRCIVLARAALLKKHQGGKAMDRYHQQQALAFLRACLASVLNITAPNADKKGETGNDLKGIMFQPPAEVGGGNQVGEVGVKTVMQLRAEQEVFKSLLSTLVSLSTDPDLTESRPAKADASSDPKRRSLKRLDSFMVHVCQHFAVLFAAEGSSPVREGKGNAALKQIDPLLFLDSLVDVLCSPNHRFSRAALQCLCIFADSLVLLIKAQRKAKRVSESAQVPTVFQELLGRLVHCCYHDAPQAQLAAVKALKEIVSRISKPWVTVPVTKVVRAFFHVLKKVPEYCESEINECEVALGSFLDVVIGDLEPLPGHSVPEKGDGAPDGGGNAQGGLPAKGKEDKKAAGGKKGKGKKGGEPQPPVAGADAATKENVRLVVETFAEQLLLSTHSGVRVRRAAEANLRRLAKWSDQGIGALLSPFVGKSLQALLGRPERPLSARSSESQLECLMAVKLCIYAEPPLIQNAGPEFMGFLQEVVKLSEGEREEAPPSKVRDECIVLLSAAVTLDEFFVPANVGICARMVTLLFKHLSNCSEAVVDAAERGLATIVEKEAMPRDSLQQSLRPILYSLQVHTHLTLNLLNGMQRLLKLLGNHFNETLGEKLVDHLKKWLEPEKLAAAQKSWRPGEEQKIASAMIELFHLLPPSASKFLESAKERPGLVALTIRLESQLPTNANSLQLTSPCRKPLVKYLNKYADASVRYFLVRMNNPAYFIRFLEIIRSEDGAPVRDSLAANSDLIFELCFKGTEKGPREGKAKTPAQAPVPTPHDLQYHAVKLIRLLAKLNPEWLKSQPAILKVLEERWNSASIIERRRNEEKLNVYQLKESKWLAKALISHCKNSGGESFGTLLNLLSVFKFPSRIDYTFLRQFVLTEVTEVYTVEDKQKATAVFTEAFKECFGKDGGDHLTLTYAVEYAILPMLEAGYTQHGPELLPDEALQSIVSALFDPPGEVSAKYTEEIRIKLLQLSTVLIKHSPSKMVHFRKELIKFGWNHLKRDGQESKLWAFVNVCHFLSAFQAPEKIILQVFVALLRNFQAEGKHLVREALDILTPALPARLQESGQARYAIWIRYTKKILVEEGHSNPHLIHIWNLLVRHARQFYSSRAQFVPHLVYSLSRLGLPQNSPLDNRKLSIDLVSVVLGWERMRKGEVASQDVEPDAGGKRKPDGPGEAEEAHGKKKVAVEAADGAPVAKAAEKKGRGKKAESQAARARKVGKGGKDDEPRGAEEEAKDAAAKALPDEYSPSPSMQETIVNFLIRMAFLTSESREPEYRSMNEQSLKLLSEAMRMWKPVNIKMAYIEKLLASNAQRNLNPMPALVTGLDVMKRALDEQPENFCLSSLEQVAQVIDPTLASQSSSVVDKLASIVLLVHNAVRADNPGPLPGMQAVHQRFDDAVTAYLSSAEKASSADAGVVKGTPAQVAAVLRILVTVTDKGHHFFVDRHAGPLVKLLKKYATEKASQPKGAPRLPADVASRLTSNICMILRLLSHKILVQQDQKQMLLHTLITLMTSKPHEGSVWLEILNAIRHWVEKSDDKNYNLSVKETVLFLQRLAPAERQGLNVADWNRNFLSTILQICTNKSKSERMKELKIETFNKVEKLGLMGLQSQEPKLRHAFFQLHNKTIERTLFARLQHIVCGQDWEAMASKFWLKQGLDFLFAILLENEKIHLAPTSSKLRPVWQQTPPLAGGRDADGDTPMQRPEGSETGEPDEGGAADEDQVAKYANALLSRHGVFMETVSKLKAADLIYPLSEFAQVDPQVAYHLWVLLFPIVWATLQKEQQLQLAKPMISLLSREFNVQQAAKRPNVVQALLEGISLSQPQPKIPSELIKFLGKTCNAWHIALPLLESHVLLFPQEGRCSDALLELYRSLNEEDFYCGLWKKRCSTENTRIALSHMQHGKWAKAQSVLLESISRVRSRALGGVPRAELAAWEESWLTCCTKMNQWSHIAEFGKKTEQYPLLLDCLWKVGEWHVLKDSIIPKIQSNDAPQQFMVQGYVHLQEGHVVEGDQCVLNGIHSVLQRWWQLPELSSEAHLPYLNIFQQLVELQESTRVLIELGSGQQQPQHSYNELKDILETWRLRLPNSWDPLCQWSEILQWRNHMYNIVINAFKGYQDISPQLHQLGYRDKAWCVNKLANVARSQGMTDVCINILTTMYGYYQMEVQEAFNKIKEQAMAYLETGNQMKQALNLVNSANLEYFQPTLQAEVFRLKGCIFEKLGNMEEASANYATSVSIDKQLHGSWFSWGKFNKEAFVKSDDPAYLENAVLCFLMGMRFGSQDAVQQIPFILNELASDSSRAFVTRAIQKCGDQVPEQYWLPFVPHLLLILQRPEAFQAKQILYKIARKSPQALHYPLRTFLLERREGAVKQPTAPAAGPAEIPTTAQAFAAGKEIMDLLRQKWGGLIRELEMFIHEVGAKFAACAEERLLAIVHALVHRCHKYPTTSASDVPEPLKQELASISKACFSAEQTSSKNHLGFIQEYRDKFLADLDPEHRAAEAGAQAGDTFPRTLGALIKRLKHWKALLEYHLEARLPKVLKLENESRALQEMPLHDILMPRKAGGQGDVFIVKVGSDIDIVRRHGASHRRLKLVGSDGKARLFLVQSGHSSTFACEERLVNLLRVFNQMLEADQGARRRKLQFHTPTMLKIWPQVRLMEDDASYSSFMSAYEINCARYGREPDLPIEHFKERCAQAVGSSLTQEQILDLRLRVFSEICTKVISENILTQYMYKTLPSSNHLWVFKKQFAHQLALTNLVSYVFKIAGRSPKRTLFSRSTGQIQQLEFFPQYDNAYTIDGNEPVPFRLTRNLQTFLTPFGVEGVFVSAFSTAARALLEKESILSSYLGLYFHDEILSWHRRRVGPEQATGPAPSQLQAYVANNVDAVLRKLKLEETSKPAGTVHSQREVTYLVEAASSPKNLCRQPAEWHPWW